MKSLLATSLLLSSTCLWSQSWLQPHSNIQLANKPSAVTIENIIGANGGTAIGISGLPEPGVIKHLRNFHHMEIDFKYGFFPSEATLNADTCDCTNAWCNNGDCSNYFLPGTKSAFESLKDHYCKWKGNKYQFQTIRASLESLFPKQTTGCASQNISRGYPNKWYSYTEFGGPANAATNFKNYVKSFARSFCPPNTNQPCLVDVLEIGNEPWGDPYPGKDGYHQLLLGAVSALRETYGSNDHLQWRMKLSLAAFQAHNAGAGPFGETWYYIDPMIPDSLKKYFDEITIHNYAFTTGAPSSGPVERPEDDNGGFLNLKNMITWRDQKMPAARMNITEFAWNAGTQGAGCADLGESTQSAYTMRAYFLAARNGVDRAYVYDFTDKNEYPFYCTTGLYQNLAGNVPRKTFKSLKKILAGDLKDKRFLKALHEDQDQANNGSTGKIVYLFGDSTGKPTHLVAWKPVKLNYENSNYPASGNTYDSIQLPDSSMKALLGTSYFMAGWDSTLDGNITNNGMGLVDINGVSASIIKLKLSGTPVIVPINAGTCRYDTSGSLINCSNPVSVANDPATGQILFSTSDQLTITLPQNHAITTIKLFSILGQCLKSIEINNSETETSIDLRDLDNGLYLIYYGSRKMGGKVKKIVVTK